MILIDTNILIDYFRGKKPAIDFINNYPTPKADCLFACFESDATIKQKEKDKAWLLYYMRWDICTEAERRNGANNVSFKHTATKGAWQLDSEKLREITNFLALF